MVVFYNLERHAYESYVVELPRAVEAPATADEAIVCHCLQVTEAVVVEAVQETGARSLCELARLTGAGSGCTSCHRRLRSFFSDRRAAASRIDVSECGS